MHFNDNDNKTAKKFIIPGRFVVVDNLSKTKTRTCGWRDRTPESVGETINRRPISTRMQSARLCVCPYCLGFLTWTVFMIFQLIIAHWFQCTDDDDDYSAPDTYCVVCICVRFVIIIAVVVVGIIIILPTEKLNAHVCACLRVFAYFYVCVYVLLFFRAQRFSQTLRQDRQIARATKFARKRLLNIKTAERSAYKFSEAHNKLNMR